MPLDDQLGLPLPVDVHVGVSLMLAGMDPVLLTLGVSETLRDTLPLKLDAPLGLSDDDAVVGCGVPLRVPVPLALKLPLLLRV